METADVAISTVVLLPFDLVRVADSLALLLHSTASKALPWEQVKGCLDRDWVKVNDVACCMCFG